MAIEPPELSGQFDDPGPESNPAKKPAETLQKASPVDVQPSKTFPILEDETQPRPLTATSDSSSNGGVKVPGHAHDDLFASSNRPTKREQLRDFKEKAKTVIHRASNARKEDRNQPLEEFGYQPDGSTNVKAALKTVAKTASPASSLLAHPRSTIKAKVTSAVATEISAFQNPSVPPKTDAELVAAHLRRDDAIDSRDPKKLKVAENNISDLNRQRKNMMLGWTMSRHVHAVKCVPQKRVPWPEKKDFLIRDENLNVVKDDLGNEQIDWLRWLGHFLLYVCQDFSMHYVEDWDQPGRLDIDRVRGIVERIFVASAPWQEWLIHVHQVYRWEDPYETFRWLLLYVTLWHYSYLGAFLYAYIVYAVLRNYFFPKTLEELRESIERARSQSRDAYRFGELVEQHGPENWLGPIAKELGPWAQLQLADIANLLEVLRNFWSWKSPRQSFYTVCFFFTCFLVSAIGDMDLCMKIVFFVLGGTFFFSFPVSNHHPKYRYLVSPLKWVLWNIPTNAEWAFEQLRLAAQNDREDIVAAKVEEDWANSVNGSATTPSRGEGVNSVDSDQDSSAGSFRSATVEPATPLDRTEPLYEFRCIFSHRRGNLAILPSGVRFTTKRGKQLWRKEWKDIIEMRKIGKKDGAGDALISSTHALGLDIGFTQGEIVRLEQLGNVRDEVFNRILGYSGLRWQWIA